MIIADRAAIHRVAAARSAVYLWYTPFRPAPLLEAVRSQHFPDLRRDVEVQAVDHGSLACICHDPGDAEGSATIFVHQLLNHPDTPPEVFEFIFAHELLHLVIPPREVDGKILNHPPEFWEAERALCPGRGLAWSWIWINLDDGLRSRPKLERIDVLRSWKKIWGHQKSTLDDVRWTQALRPAPAEEAGW